MAKRNDQGVYLTQVYPEADVDTDLDIIAIHGLDTQSPETWTWRNKDGSSVNWLADKNMLPSVAGRARIFTCDWPSRLQQPPHMVQKSLDQHALLLLEGIKTRPPPSRGTLEARPILFIASCLGGIILVKALVDTGRTYDSVFKATRGVLFLATPFQGTSLQMVVSSARLLLKAKAAVHNTQVSVLLDVLGGPTFELYSLVHKFTSIYVHDPLFQVFNFFETKTTSLPRKVIPWLPGPLAKEVPLVNEMSATLQMVPNPLPLNRNHVLMNKFAGPDCPDYRAVSAKLQEMIGNIRNGMPIVQADAWIQNRCYTADRLNMDCIDGSQISIAEYYIHANMAMDGASANSDVSLQTLFARPGPAARRVWIRGAPGVGKTALCQRIVYDFQQGLWDDQFDRILWIPLETLKSSKVTTESVAKFFQFVFFSQTSQSPVLAEELWRRTDGAAGDRTLFLLDGLDEVVHDLPATSHAGRILMCLLNQQCVLITSRPRQSLPAGVRPVDLTLQMAPLYPNQVREYVTKRDQASAADMMAFLDQHPSVADIVRVPAHLNAFCSAFQPEQTTTAAVFAAIELCLWNKDLLRLKKNASGLPLVQPLTTNVHMPQLDSLAGDEVALVYGLAFTGLCNNLVDFSPPHQKAIATYFRAPNSKCPVLHPDMVLPHLSFLQAADSGATTYRFTHPVLRDYLAACYFVQKQTAKEPLILLDANQRPISMESKAFLRANKEKPHYEIFWRFVADTSKAGRPS